MTRISTFRFSFHNLKLDKARHKTKINDNFRNHLTTN